MLGYRALLSDLARAVPAHPSPARTPLAPARTGGSRRPAGQPADCPGGPKTGRRRPGTLPRRRAGPPGHARGDDRRDSSCHPRPRHKHPTGAPRRRAAPGQSGQAAHSVQCPGFPHRVLAGGNDWRGRGRRYDRPTGGPGELGLRGGGGHLQGARGFTFYCSRPHARAAGPAWSCRWRGSRDRQAVGDRLAPADAPDSGRTAGRGGRLGCRHDPSGR